jgi:hypothetical protein
LSRLFKRPKPLINMGNSYARLIKSARNIQNQAELDLILSRVAPEMGQAWLNIVREHLRFVPAERTVEAAKDETFASQEENAVR